jgi:hypothetical protein
MSQVPPPDSENASLAPTTPEPAPAARKVRRRRRLSRLALLLIAVAVVGIVIANMRNRAERQRVLVDQILKAYGWIAYDFEFQGPSRGFTREAMARRNQSLYFNDQRAEFPDEAPQFAPAASGLVRAIDQSLGIDFLHHVVAVNLIADRLSDDSVAQIGTLPHLEDLKLSRNPSHSRSAFARLIRNLGRHRDSIRVLGLRTLDLDDSMWEPLRGACSLEEVYVESNHEHPLSSVFFAVLRTWKQLRKLRLDSTVLEDSLAESLSELPRLQELENFLSCKLTDAFLHRISNSSSSLQRIDIHSDNFTADGYLALRNIKSLKTVWFSPNHDKDPRRGYQGYTSPPNWARVKAGFDATRPDVVILWSGSAPTPEAVAAAASQL